ncbi:MAG TPA: PAS domain-containing protein, partial [Terriglobales bacterium]|nr:PAS domain-containing protein [Terriglobales bacterium]
MAWQFSPEALVGTRRLGRISKPIIRLALCIVAVLAVVVALSVIHVQQDRILSAALNLFLIVVLIASICWGTGYAIFVSFLSTLGFMGSLRPFGYFHLSDGRIWTLLTACLVTGVVASRLSSRVRQSDKQLRDVIETIPAMAFSILPDGSTAFVNGRVLEYTGLSADTISGPGWQSTVHPEDFESHMTKWLAAMASGEPFENEVRHRNAKGEYRWFLVRAVPLRDAQGKILKWYGILTDIEDRKRSEDELRTALSERAQLAVVREEIGMALAHKDNLRGILHECVETVVRHLDAAFARIWTLSSDGTELQLQASAGMYRHLDGRHSRIPFGELKVGQIAKERKAYLTNDVQNDPR